MGKEANVELVYKTLAEILERKYNIEITIHSITRIDGTDIKQSNETEQAKSRP